MMSISQKVRIFASVLRFDCFINLLTEKKMKKLAFVFAAVVAVSFAACGNSTKAEGEAACGDSTCCGDTTEVVDTHGCDSVSADTLNAEL